MEFLKTMTTSINFKHTDLYQKRVQHTPTINTFGNKKTTQLAYQNNLMPLQSHLNFISFNGKKDAIKRPLSPGEIEVLRLRNAQAMELYKNLPLALQFISSTADGKVTYNKIKALEEKLQGSSDLADAHKTIFVDKTPESLRKQEKDFYNTLYNSFANFYMNKENVVLGTSDPDLQSLLVLKLYNSWRIAGLNFELLDLEGFDTLLRSITNQNQKTQFIDEFIKQFSGYDPLIAILHLPKITDQQLFEKLLDVLYVEGDKGKYRREVLVKVIAKSLKCKARDDMILKLAQEPEVCVLLCNKINEIDTDYLKERLINKFLENIETLKPGILNRKLENLTPNEIDRMNKFCVEVCSGMLPELKNIKNMFFRNSMIAAFLNDTASRDKFAVGLIGLSNQDYPERNNILLKLAKEKPDVKTAIALNLHQISELDLVDSLCKDLTNLDDPEYKKLLFENLSNIKFKPLKDKLVELYSTDSEYKLQLIKNNDLFAQLDPQVIRRLSKDTSEVKLAISQCLHLINDSTLKTELINSFINDSDTKIPLINNPEILSILDSTTLNKLLNDSMDVKTALAKNIGNIKNEQIRNKIVLELLKLDDIHVLAELISNLHIFQDGSLKNTLLNKSINSQDNEIKIALLSKLHLINNETDRNKLIAEFAENKEPEIQKKLTETIPLIPNFKINNDLFHRFSKGGYEVLMAVLSKKGMEGFENLDDEALTLIKVFEELNTLSSELGLGDLEEVKDKFKQPFTNYIKLFNDEIIQTDESKILSYNKIAQTLYTLYDRVDGSALKKLIADFNSFYNYADTFKHQFPNADEEHLTEKDIKQYISEKANKILLALFLTGKPTVIDVFTHKRIAFEDFLEGIVKLIADNDLIEPIKKVCSIPIPPGKTYRFNKLVNFAQGLVELNKKDVLLEQLNRAYSA